MKCFYHHDRDAVGTCKSCQRGVCPECAVEFPRGLACRGHCEEEAQAVIALVERNVKLAPVTQRLLASTRTRSIQAAVFSVVTGGIFVWYGVTHDFDLGTMLGAGYVIYGILQGTRLANLPKVVPIE